MEWLFNERIPHIYFVYGLAFFAMGLAVALEIGRGEPTPFRRAMRPLAVFGILHGSHEWVDMFALIGRQAYDFEPNVGFAILRLTLLAVSFASLIAFGVQMLRPVKKMPYPDFWIGLGMLLLYGLCVTLLGWWVNWQADAWPQAADALARYMLGIPGAVLAAGALLVQRKTFLRLNQHEFARDLLWAAVAFALYGVVGQFIVTPAPIFPANVINTDTFKVWFVMPIQLVRAILAVMIAVFTIRALRAFEVIRRQELAAVRERVRQEIAHRDAMRQEFLKRLVTAQEDERSRISRELHDEFGQLLTGLALGLRGAQASAHKPDVVAPQLAQLEKMAVQGLADMRRLVNELRPALLDDVGLEAALRHYAQNFAELSGIKTNVDLDEHPNRLPGQLETILFRITQEALTNIARHTNATQATIYLRCNNGTVRLNITDNGQGFDPEATSQGTGLLGIAERVRLANGDFQIQSEPDAGTRLIIQVPLVNSGVETHVPDYVNAGG
ncbi:MAG: sensor histidine kinase [Chloroflexi bacterium]|nr:MAG: sensor histidine kinase [Chloroflexota bacterium]